MGEKKREDFRSVRMYVCDYHQVLVQVLASGFHSPQSHTGLPRRQKQRPNLLDWFWASWFTSLTSWLRLLGQGVITSLFRCLNQCPEHVCDHSPGRPPSCRLQFHLEVPSNTEALDYLVQVCFIWTGAKLYGALVLEEKNWTQLLLVFLAAPFKAVFPNPAPASSPTVHIFKLFLILQT